MLGPLPAPQVFRHVMRALALTCCGLASSVHPPQQQAPVPVDEPSSSSSSSSSFAAIGPAVNFSAPSSASLERFITSASKHSRQPLFHQGSLPALTNNGTASRQPWEQHVTPFPAVIFDASWAPPLGPFRLYYAVQTDCGFVHGESKFESCHPDSCSIALATSADGAGTSPPRFFWHEIDAILPRKARDKND